MKHPALRVVKNEATPKEASIYLYGIIGDYWYSEDPLTARKFLKSLSALETSYEIINIHINSPGGDVFEGLAISNAIRASKREIHTWNDGLAASMGAAILLSAKKGNRHAAKASVTMLHNASTGFWGNAGGMRETADFLDTVDATLSSLIADAGGITVTDAIAKYMDYKDHWLSSEEAQDAGFVTVEDYQAEEIPATEDLKNMDKVAAFYHPKFSPKNQQTEMSLFKNKFPKMSALSKKPKAELKPDEVEAINLEIAENEIEGVTLVLDDELEQLATEAEKVPALEAKVKELEDGNATVVALNAKITDLEKTVKEQKAKLDAPSEAPATPPAKADDEQPENGKVMDSFKTSVDSELEKYLNS